MWLRNTRILCKVGFVWTASYVSTIQGVAWLQRRWKRRFVGTFLRDNHYSLFC